MLFQGKVRTSQDPKSYGEGDWEYLDRSGRVEAQRVRAFLNHWVSQYPASDRDELISRIASRDDRNFDSATFELVLFALMQSLGCSITVHPGLGTKNSSHPDFLVVTPNEETVYIEAVLASEYSEADISGKKRTDAVLTAIEKIDSPNFFLAVGADGHPDVPPNAKTLRSDLERWLASLDPDLVAREMSQGKPACQPKIEWENEGWHITFWAIPKNPENRGKRQRVIGALVGRTRFVNAWEPIRDAVKNKGKRYGRLISPFIVAVNVDALAVDALDEKRGLFGEGEHVFRKRDACVPPHTLRRPEGAWTGPNGPQYTRVSGAWLFRKLSPWNIASCVNTLYFNPWAMNALPSLFTVPNHAKADSDTLQWVSGRSLVDILGLPPRWPE